MKKLISIFLFICSGGYAYADGAPRDGAYGFQPAATRIAEMISNFHAPVFWLMVAITIFVLGLIAYVCIRFRAKANPEPANFSHNVTIEVIWTVIPVAIVVVLGAVSLEVLYYTDQQPDLVEIAENGYLSDPNVNVEAAKKGWITMKAEGNQWNWKYYFPDLVDDGEMLSFTANPMHTGLSSDPTTGWRNLSTDYPLVLPVNRYVRFQTAATDVIHSWAVPSFGIKTDAVPGRLNEGWFLVRETGTYYGQCSEFCGKNHAFMPIEIRVVEQDQFDLWVKFMHTGDWDRAKGYVDSVQPEPSYGGPAGAQVSID